MTREENNTVGVAAAVTGNERVLTFGADYQVVLSHRCAYTCGYCDFARTSSPHLPSVKQMQRHHSIAKKQGVDQITLTCGMGIDTNFDILSGIKYLGYKTWTDYLQILCDTVLTCNGKRRRPLLPILDCGGASLSDLCQIRPSCPILRVFLGSADDNLLHTKVHMYAPQKSLANSLKRLQMPGQIGIATITGIYVGIGESRESWGVAARCVSQLHEKYGHIAMFSLVPFVPNPFSPMAMCLPPTDKDLVDAVKIVRKYLDPSIPLSVELFDRPHLMRQMVELGVSDIGCCHIGTNTMLNIFNSEEVISSIQEELSGQRVVVKSRNQSLLHFIHNRKLPTHLLDSKAEVDLAILLEKIYHSAQQSPNCIA